MGARDDESKDPLSIQASYVMGAAITTIEALLSNLPILCGIISLYKKDPTLRESPRRVPCSV